MELTEKETIKKELVSCLSANQDVNKIVIFGSFFTAENPKDLDVAVFQSSTEGYIPLAMRYRKQTRTIAKKIPIDIFPVKADAKNNSLLSEIADGEVVYER